MVTITRSSEPHQAAGRLELRKSNACSLLISRCGYQQTSSWDLDQLRAQLGKWRKYLTPGDGHVWPLYGGALGRIRLLQASGEQLQPLTAIWNVGTAVPGDCAGGERLVRLSDIACWARKQLQENLNEHFCSNLALSRQTSLSRTPWVTGILTYCPALVVVLRMLRASKVGNEVANIFFLHEAALSLSSECLSKAKIHRPSDATLNESFSSITSKTQFSVAPAWAIR